MVRDYKIVKQYRIANLGCKAFQTVKFFYYKTTAKKMISTTTSPAAAKEPDVQSRSSQLDLIRRHLRPEKRINRRQTHTDFSLDICILTPVTGEQVSSQNEPLPNRQRDKMPPSLKKTQNSKVCLPFTSSYIVAHPVYAYSI